MKNKTLLTFALLSIFLVTLLAQSVSAFDFDNVKSYDAQKREITVTNAFGIGAEVAKIKHLNPQSYNLFLNDGETCESYAKGIGYNCKVAEFNIQTDSDSYPKALKQLEFYNLNKDFAEVGFTYSFRERVEVGKENRDIYDFVCRDDDKNNSQSCNYQKVGTKEVNIYEYRPITRDLIKGNKVIALYVDRIRSGEHIEFIPTFFGVRIQEWADFSSYTLYTEQTNIAGGAGGAIQPGSTRIRGNTFKVPEDIVLKGISLYCQDYNTENWDLDIYAISGGIPNGTVLGSTTILASEVPDNPNPDWFNASLNDVTLYANVSYGYAPAVAEASGSASMDCHTADGDYYANGERIKYQSGTWTTDGNDQAFMIWGIPAISPPTVTLNSPENNTISSSASINFNWSASISNGFNLTNTSFYLNDVLNYSVDLAGATNDTTQNYTLVLGEGSYNWSAGAVGDNDQEFITDNYALTIDLTSPVVNIELPVNATQYISYNPTLNVTFNLSISDNLGLDTCWYNNGTGNTVFTCGNNVTQEFGNGWSEVIVYANDTAGHETNDAVSFFINVVNESWGYINPIVEQEDQYISFYLTADSISSFNGTMYYNNTAVGTTSLTSNSTFANLTAFATSPLVLSNQQVPIYVNYTLNGENYTSAQVTQDVNVLTDIIVSASCDDKALRFDITDEQDLTAVYGDVQYNIKFGTSNATLKTVYGSLSNVTTFYGCINATASPNYTVGYGEFQYEATNYVNRRYYLFEDQVISNATLTNHTLYELLSASQTSFIIEAEDTDLTKYAEKYTALWRWYPDLNEYRVVDMGQTDENGETVAHVETEDVDYRVGIYETNGTLIKLGEPVRFVCSSAPCRFTLRVDANEVDFTNYLNVQSSLTFNDTTKIFTYIYNDPSQDTDEMRLLVERITGTSELVICDNTASGYTGVISCDVSSYTGTFRATAYRTASPETPIAQKVVNLANTVFRDSRFGLFISALIWLAIVLTGFSSASGSPIIILILGIVGLIPALIMGSITPIIFTGFIVIIAIVIHFIKRARAP